MVTQTLSHTCIKITGDTDVVVACQKGRILAKKFGFSILDQFITTTAISEIAHNIVTYASNGEISLTVIAQDHRHGLRVIATDAGPGIPDLAMAMQDGYSTGVGLGLGLSGAKRLMDEFEITSAVGKGTTITMTKWGAEW